MAPPDQHTAGGAAVHPKVQSNVQRCTECELMWVSNL